MEERQPFLKLTFQTPLTRSVFTLLLVVFACFSSLASSSSLELPIQIIDGITKEPLIGVSVYTDDMSTFTGVTDYDGKIVLKNLSHRDLVNFTYIGYQSLKIPFFELRKKGGKLSMFLGSNGLDTLVIVGRTDAPQEEIPYQVNRITKEDIELLNTQTTADALMNTGGAYVQKSQYGGGSPILRGFEANRVLLVVDGVRMNNAIYRNGHLQNAITVDNELLNQMEVIYGPGSLMYGSDALGGVVHFRTKDPRIIFDDGLDYGKIQTNAFFRFGTPIAQNSAYSTQTTSHIDFDYGARKWGSITSITYSDFGDLRAGANRPEAYPDLGKREFFPFRNEDIDEIRQRDPNIQTATGYSQIDLMQKLRFQPSDSLYFVVNLQYSTTNNIPRYDALTDTIGAADEPKWSEWYYGPQQRILASFKTRTFKPAGIYDKATIIGAFQKIDEDRITRKFAKARREFNLEDVYVYSLTADMDKNLDKSGHNVFAYGLEGNHNQVFSVAGKERVSNGAISGGVFTRYPNDFSTMTTGAGYANYRWKSRDSTINFSMGARYSYVRLFAKYSNEDQNLVEWPQSMTDGLEVENTNLSYAAGITWNSRNNWQFRILAGTAFRSPNIDDLAKVRMKGNIALMPNPDLGPETARNAEITLAKEFGNRRGGTSFKISGTGFYTLLENAIVRLPGTVPGSGDSTIIVDGELFGIQQNFNVDEATIYGISGNTSLTINKNWQIRAGLNYTKGTTSFTTYSDNGNIELDTITPLAHIPPLYGQASIGYQTDKFSIEAVARYNGPKLLEDYSVSSIEINERGDIERIDRFDTSDNLEQSGTCVNLNENGIRSVECEGTLAWTTYNLYTSYKISKKLTFNFSIENILDTHYRPFASGVSGVGRNFVFSLRGKF